MPLSHALRNVARVILGKDQTVKLALAALLSNGHVLIEDVPGVGKTVLAKALTRTFGGTFKRIQFTPDLLPSDVTGVSVYNQRTGAFEFRPGPLFAHVVLADEINRATPKTQSALLEAMEERQVSVDGTTYPLPEPFLVLATQNPVEYEGTFPLPEAQLDRFLLRIALGYPSREHELALLERAADPTALDGQEPGSGRHPVEALPQVVSLGELRAFQAAARRVRVDRLIREYVVALVAATREHPDVQLGASPRGSLALLRAGQAWALLHDRDFVSPDDVKSLAEPALAHRLILAPGTRPRGLDARTLIAELLASLPVPGARARW
ncbi:MAG TPA: MoxR family ATPase [Chloroflexota bacterium]|nr:MoxR family ATPase [Chloroflexota bacterium]